MKFVLPIVLLVVFTIGFSCMLMYENTKYFYPIFTITLAISSVLLYLIVRSAKG